MVARSPLRMMRLAFLVLVMDFGLAAGSDIPAAFLDEKNACSFSIKFTAHLPHAARELPKTLFAVQASKQGADGMKTGGSPR